MIKHTKLPSAGTSCVWIAEVGSVIPDDHVFRRCSAGATPWDARQLVALAQPIE